LPRPGCALCVDGEAEGVPLEKPRAFL
jgi:hypothetical protein